MKTPGRLGSTFLLPLALTLSGLSCSVVKDISQSLTNLSRCRFKLVNVSDVDVAGVTLAGTSSLDLRDRASLASAWASGSLPATFTVNVAAVNPNDGREGTTRTTAVLTGFAWKLLVDDVQTINGDITSPVRIPDTGEQVIIPLRMQLDLYAFFRDKSYNQIIKLALALAGTQGSASRLTLRATPTIRTDYGPITYPGELTIIDKEFRGQ